MVTPPLTILWRCSEFCKHMACSSHVHMHKHTCVFMHAFPALYAITWNYRMCFRFAICSHNIRRIFAVSCWLSTYRYLHCDRICCKRHDFITRMLSWTKIHGNEGNFIHCFASLNSCDSNSDLSSFVNDEPWNYYSHFN